jgi:pimeloyl-ACP methyl ester carboxylesterase
VFLPGLGGSRTDWMPVARKLLAGHRVVMVDLPGHGESALPDPFSFAEAGAALDAVLARQNADSTIVVASQFGGRVALAALAAHPERARGLLLVNTPLGVPMAIDDQRKKMFLNYMDMQYETVSKMMFGKLGRDSTQNASIYALFTQTSPATVKAFVREAFYSDGNSDWKRLPFPVAFVATGSAWRGNATNGVVMERFGWADTTAVVPQRLDDAEYWAMKDQPEQLAKLIGDYAASRWAAKR